jgi:aryl-alcohol dehydrogenase-like predicted oxidoreductase
MKLTRRDLMKLGLGATALAAAPRLFSAAATAPATPAPAATLPLITKAIPSTGEKIPAVGIGTRTYATVTDGIREVLKGLGESGCTMVDTAAGYGNSENVIGDITQGLGNRAKLFLATKVGANGGRAEIDASFTRLRTDKIDLHYVWNLGNTDTNLGLLREYKAAGKIRYIGVTTSSDNQYGQLEQIMRNQALDFVQLDYAIDNRGVEERLLPLAIDRKIAVVTNLPFGRANLFAKVAGKNLPEWAAEIDCTTWAQFFLKYNVSHPAVTVAIPGTTQPRNLVDNVQGARGRLPDAAMRTRMEQIMAAL